MSSDLLERFVAAVADDAEQRWTRYQQTWRRPEDGGFDRRLYKVVALDHVTARGFVMEHHYSRSYGAVKRCGRYGMVERATDNLVGVAAFGVPASRHLIPNTFPGLGYDRAAELLRFVLLDEVPSNAETWFAGQALHALTGHGLLGLVAHSDPVPRVVDGRVLMPGHIGGIYRDGGWGYVGQADKRIQRQLPDGTVLNDRSAQKLPGRERGGLGVVATLVGFGADPLADRDDRREWLRYWTAQLTTPVRQPGVHRYVRLLGSRTQRRHTVMPLEFREPPRKNVTSV